MKAKYNNDKYDKTYLRSIRRQLYLVQVPASIVTLEWESVESDREEKEKGE